MSNKEHDAPAMTCEQFVDSIDNLVREWATDAEIEVAAGAIPRAQLEAIYNEVRNSTAYELALAQEQLDSALAKLHKHYTKGKDT
jgi:hypothetical protein